MEYIDIDPKKFVPKYEVEDTWYDDVICGEYLGRYDTKEEALKVINDMELKEGHKYVIEYKRPDIYGG